MGFHALHLLPGGDKAFINSRRPMDEKQEPQPRLASIREREELVRLRAQLESEGKVLPHQGQHQGNVSLGEVEVENRFGYHRPTLENAQTHIDLRISFRRFAEYLDATIPAGRAKNVAFERLEDASMWSHKAVAELAPVVTDEPK
jgi:hypothetical protein